MANELDAFSLNVKGVENLVESPTNKIPGQGGNIPEGVAGEKYDALSVDMSDDELLKLRNTYEKEYSPYESKLKPRVEKIKNSYLGKNPQGQYLIDTELPIAANLQWESMETFLSAALAKNPSPFVLVDNTPEGNEIATAIRTMLQFHADKLVLRRKLAIMVRQWATELLGVLEPGWDSKLGDVDIENGKISGYVFDPNGYVNAYGDFTSWFGKRKDITAEKLIELFPKCKEYIETMVEGRLGTKVTYTEWWPNDEFCFYTFKNKVLDKHKNQYFKYPEPEKDALGNDVIDPITGEVKMTEPRNHFAYPKKPAIFLSVYSLQEQPHDITSNMEQNIPNQNLISRRTDQIDYNVSTMNNSFALSMENFNQETGAQFANARKIGNPTLIPQGGPANQAITELQAKALPADVFNALEISKNDLKSSWGIQGITPDNQDEDQTARGMILRQAQDSSRIGGGIGQAIEQVADNAFNWLVQLYYVFYDEEHFAAIMGGAKSIEFVTISNADLNRQIIVSVAPDSMIPKDPVTESNMAQALFDKGAIGPITLLKSLSFPNPDEAAADGVFYQVDKAAYLQAHWPELMQQIQATQQEQAQLKAMQGAEAIGMNRMVEAATTPPEMVTEPEQDLSQEPANASLSQVPLPQ